MFQQDKMENLNWLVAESLLEKNIQKITIILFYFHIMPYSFKILVHEITL